MLGCNSLGQGINIGLVAMCEINPINQTQVFTSILASTFDDLINSHIFLFTYEFLRILRVILDEFSNEYLLAMASGRIVVVGTKVFELSPLSIVMSNPLARLNIESGISPLCLQIHFCINSSTHIHFLI